MADGTMTSTFAQGGTSLRSPRVMDAQRIVAIKNSSREAFYVPVGKAADEARYLRQDGWAVTVHEPEQGVSRNQVFNSITDKHAGISLETLG